MRALGSGFFRARRRSRVEGRQVTEHRKQHVHAQSIDGTCEGRCAGYDEFESMAALAERDRLPRAAPPIGPRGSTSSISGAGIPPRRETTSSPRVAVGKPSTTARMARWAASTPSLPTTRGSAFVSPRARQARPRTEQGRPSAPLLGHPLRRSRGRACSRATRRPWRGRPRWRTHSKISRGIRDARP
jgi:hypothetical protein